MSDERKPTTEDLERARQHGAIGIALTDSTPNPDGTHDALIEFLPMQCPQCLAHEAEIRRLQALNESLAARCHGQSEILSQRAEKKASGP